MSTIKRDFKRWLQRVEAAASAIEPAGLEAARKRELLRLLVKMCDLIREQFLLMGLDPAFAPRLRRGEEAAAELAAIPDTDELRAADKSIIRSVSTDNGEKPTKPEEKFVNMVKNMYHNFQKNGTNSYPNCANASLAELYAFSIAMKILPGRAQASSPGNATEFADGQPAPAST